MKVDLEVNQNYEETIIVIKTPKVTDEITELIHQLKTSKPKNIVGKSENRMVILKPNDIVCVYSENQRVKADTKNGTYEIKQRLYEIEKELGNLSFVRISKSAIANINQIRDIEVSFNGSLVINFINGKKEYISRQYVLKVKEYLGIGGK